MFAWLCLCVRTEILHILIPGDTQSIALALPTFGTGPVALEDHDAVGSGCGDEGGAVAVAGPC